MGAEPDRRSLKMPAEKLGPVIVTWENIALLFWLYTPVYQKLHASR